MGYRVFEKLVRYEGYCCPYAYLRAHITYRTAPLAEGHLGIHRRTLRKWREQYRKGQIKCQNAEGCMCQGGQNGTTSSSTKATAQSISPSAGGEADSHTSTSTSLAAGLSGTAISSSPGCSDPDPGNASAVPDPENHAA